MPFLKNLICMQTRVSVLGVMLAGPCCHRCAERLARLRDALDHVRSRGDVLVGMHGDSFV